MADEYQRLPQGDPDITTWTNKQMALFVAAIGIGFLLVMIAVYDLTHWDMMKAMNACEGRPNHVWIDGRRGGCVQTEGNH